VGLTTKKIRIAIRWMHIVFGLVVMCYIYSPFHKFVAFQVIMKFLIIPVLTLSGIWIWKFRSIHALLGIKEG